MFHSEDIRTEDLDALREELERCAPPSARWNAAPEDVRKSVLELVLTLVEFVRRILERQAIRRMERDTLDPEEVERVGLALMKLEETIHELAEQFDIDPRRLGLDLGPLGRLF